ncbi:MAG: exosortase/archaeosortase family protein [Blastocatellia bacterium]|nr:exosortase/archaeosortase family protein [Blastocatellia bacterium]
MKWTERVGVEGATLLRGAGIGIAWGILYFDTLRRLVDDWIVDENYSHGFLLPVVGLYAIWSEREELRATPVAPRAGRGMAMMAAALLTLFAGIVSAELYLARVSILLSLAALAVYFGGMGWLRRLAFPIGLLFLAIPIPNLIFNQAAFPMQLLASDYAARAIRWCGIPALREGNVIELAQMKLQVVEACSGIRSLVSLSALAVVYARFTETRWWRRVALVAAVAPIAILTNAARVTGTGLLAHRWGLQAAEGFLHGFSGWLIFLLAVLLLMGFAQTLGLAERLIRREAP